MDPKFLSGLGKIRIMRIGIICIERDWDLPLNLSGLDKTPDYHVQIKQSCLCFT